MDGKKKPRQRNRPRNKANRSNGELCQKELNKEVNENSKSEEKNVFSEENVTEKEQEQQIVHREAIVEDNIGPGLNSAEDQLASPQAIPDKSNSLQLLQHMMRKRLLQKQQNSEDKPSASQTEEVCKRKPPEGSNTGAKKECGNTAGGKSLTAKKSSSNNILPEQGAFISNLQKKLETSVANGSTDLPNTLLENLQKLLNEGPLSDVESSDDEDYVEYVFKPRQHFLVALCNFCKNDLTGKVKIHCSRCNLVYYCMVDHMKCDAEHRQVCYALQQVADNSDGHIFRKCSEFTAEQFRSYRIVTIRTIESIINRPLTASQQEVILFPRICCDTSCREYDFRKLADCEHCGQAAYCRDKPEHLTKIHNQWCQSYQLFKELEVIQARFGQIEPAMPTKILRDIPGACCNTKQILSKLDCAAVHDPCEFAALSQVSTCPLTAWYALKLCGHLKKTEETTVHLIGAEIEFEVDAIHKWEIFFLHINPNTKKLNVVFVGPELNQGNVPFAQLMKTKCCRSCRKLQRTVRYSFQSQLYHDYFKLPAFLPPDLICFFNAGLYRYNGFQMEDTWPETIRIATNIKCPIVVTSYTEYEAPLDISRLMQESSRHLNVVLPPTLNPMASKKPERNFISDEDAPLMFKNYYCFVVE